MRAVAARMETAATARLGAETFEALEAWLALGINLAAVECFALVGVTGDLVGSIELGEARGRLWVVLVGVGMQLLCEAAIGALDVRLARTLGNPQYVVGVAHRIQTPVKSPARRPIPAV